MLLLIILPIIFKIKIKNHYQKSKSLNYSHIQNPKTQNLTSTTKNTNQFKTQIITNQLKT
jgi:hypothetical protein